MTRVPMMSMAWSPRRSCRSPARPRCRRRLALHCSTLMPASLPIAARRSSTTTRIIDQIDSGAIAQGAERRHHLHLPRQEPSDRPLQQSDRRLYRRPRPVASFSDAQRVGARGSITLWDDLIPQQLQRNQRPRRRHPVRQFARSGAGLCLLSRHQGLEIPERRVRRRSRRVNWHQRLVQLRRLRHAPPGPRAWPRARPVAIPAPIISIPTTSDLTYANWRRICAGQQAIYDHVLLAADRNRRAADQLARSA